jgi:hypothetical protein
MKLIFKFLFFVVLLFVFQTCARKGRPDGGPKDETAPLMVTSDPPYETIKFAKKKIKIYFDEYITLKDLNDQLVVSPPLKNPPIILPQGSPSKYINIEILDTLKQNTTYIFNFGNAVQDNNEGNKLERFKYVFSTGNYIDSLRTIGTIRDAFSDKTDRSINILLYRIDSAYTDSIIYKQKPDYVTSTLDTTNYDFSNLRKGAYFLFALKEVSNDYMYNPLTDKVAFSLDTVQLPRDSVIVKELRLFNEIPPYIFKRGKEVSKGKIQFGFQGNAANLQIEMLSDAPADFKTVSKFEKDKDTLNYWYRPFEVDSLNFIVRNGLILDTVTVNLRKNEIDSLKIKSSVRGNFNLKDTFYFEMNNPIVKIDTAKISLVDKDTIAVNFKTILSSTENKIKLLFEHKPKEKYTISVLPEAFFDIYEQKNDTLRYNLTTKGIEDFGRITLNVQNEESENLIIELLDEKDVLIEKQFTSNTSNIIFDLLVPKTYKIRVTIDSNNNKIWDTGNLVQKIIPEMVLYFSKELVVRANYYLNETFTIKY